MTIEKLKATGKEVSTGGKITYDNAYKKMVIDFHYKSGLSLYSLGKEIGVSNQSLSVWKREFGKDATGFRWGNTVRYDVRTKCLAIADELDHGMSTVAIANKYNITRAQYYNWKSKYRSAYKDHIENMVDGVPYLVDTEKHVAGMDNIKKVRALLQEDEKEMVNMINTMHKFGIVTKEAKSKLAKIKKAEEALKDL